MVQLSILFGLIVIGYVFGRIAENNHYKSITQREEVYLRLPCTTNKLPLQTERKILRSEMVRGDVVISVDYFKRIVAGLRALVGGNVTTYETLVDRARREAILRMKERARGADEIVNLRIETSSVFKGQQGQVGSVEVIAYGTAVFYRAVLD
ncbi:MAG: heavy metal-binding domain-containing protein [Alteromonadaceae bacterium]|nr:heavy metal-binding domain-containing protein [Alteromonadaceae bacterium]